MAGSLPTFYHLRQGLSSGPTGCHLSLFILSRQPGEELNGGLEQKQAMIFFTILS